MPLPSFFSKKRPKEDSAQDEVRGAAAPDVKQAKSDAAAEKARIKKIRAMKKKFDETVWEAACDTMRTQIPQFTIMDPDPEIPGGEIPRYVVLGFDTRIVDDFANKSDDDVGSIMSAIKHSMDCVIEDALFDNELILVIPTPKSLAALAEFEETFELKFAIVYVTEDHGMSLETKSPDKEDDFVYVTLQEIRDMLKDSVPVKDLIHGLQVRVGSNGDYGGLTGTETTETKPADSIDAPPDDDALPEDDYNKSYGEPESEPGQAGDDGGQPGPGETGPAPTAADIKNAVDTAAQNAAQVADKVTGIKEEAKDAAPAQPVPEQAPAQPQTGNDPAGAGAAKSASDRINRLRRAAQAATAQAKQDPEVQAQQAAMAAPQRQQFDMAAMDKYVVRQYYSDDLGLVISSEPFDAMFLQSNPYVPFQEVISDGWLDGYVNNLRRDANARLAKLHYENLLLMRQRFVTIVTAHCADITKSVATDDPKSRFGFVKAQIDAHKEADLAEIPAKAEAYKQQAEDAFQSRLKAEMENAANVAKANFMNRYSKEHERELREIETDLRNNLEAEAVTALENLHAQRRAEAKRQLDAGISEALRICKDEYTKMLAIERQEYARLQDVIISYMNEHMAADEAKTTVAMESLRRDDEVARVYNESAAALQAAQADFEARVADIRAEQQRSSIANENYVNELKDQQAHAIREMQNNHAETVAHKEAEIQMLKGQLDQADKRMDEMAKKFVNLDAETEKKYATQIAMIKSERDAWDERAQHLQRLHGYTDKIKITSVAIGFAVCIGIGVIIGCAFMAGSAQRAIDKQAESITGQQSGQPPEVHYYIDGEEVDGPGEADSGEDTGQEGGGADEQ